MTRYTKHNTLEREIYLTQLNNVWWIIFSHQLLPRYSFIALWIHFLKITEACPGSFQFHFLPSVNAGAFYCHFCVVLFVLLGGGPEVPRNTWSPPLPVPLLLSLRTQSSVAPGARTEEEPPGLTIKQLDWLVHFRSDIQMLLPPAVLYFAIKTQLKTPKVQSLLFGALGRRIIDSCCEFKPSLCHKDTEKD